MSCLDAVRSQVQDGLGLFSAATESGPGPA
jgi:hypothetical protein